MYTPTAQEVKSFVFRIGQDEKGRERLRDENFLLEFNLNKQGVNRLDQRPIFDLDTPIRLMFGNVGDASWDWVCLSHFELSRTWPDGAGFVDVPEPELSNTLIQTYGVKVGNELILRLPEETREWVKINVPDDEFSYAVVKFDLYARSGQGKDAKWGYLDPGFGIKP